MTLSNLPQEPNSSAKFRLTGFPEEAPIRGSLERFYRLKTDAPREFVILNTFDEQIFSGAVSEDGKVQMLNATPRSGKTYNEKASENK